MTERAFPDLCDKTPSDLLCPSCLSRRIASRLFYALNTHRFVCKTCGPAVTGEAVAAIIPSTPPKEGPHA